MRVKNRTACVVCQKKLARIGKKEGGYEHNLLCSIRCAVDYFLDNAMDFVFCDNCNQWMQCCTCICEKHSKLKMFCTCAVDEEDD